MRMRRFTNSRRAEKQVRSKVDFLKVAYVHAYMGGLGFGFRARDIWWTDICLCMSGFTCGCVNYICRPNLSVFEVRDSLAMDKTIVKITNGHDPLAHPRPDPPFPRQASDTWGSPEVFQRTNPFSVSMRRAGLVLVRVRVRVRVRI